MTRNSYVSKSESISAGHQKKDCGSISDAVKCDIQLNYAIGITRLLSIYVDTFETAQIDEVQIKKTVLQCVNLTPSGIRTHLVLNKPFCQRTAAYGHFGRELDTNDEFGWERTELIDVLKFTI